MYKYCTNGIIVIIENTHNGNKNEIRIYKCIKMNTNAVAVSNSSNQQTHYCNSKSDSLDDVDEADRYNLFLQEYFHKQFLRMQEIYPPSFKSKVFDQKNEKIFKWSVFSMLRNAKERLDKSIPFARSKPTTYTEKTVFKERKNISTLSDIIIDSMEKLGIIHFDADINGWVYTEE